MLLKLNFIYSLKNKLYFVAEEGTFTAETNKSCKRNNVIIVIVFYGYYISFQGEKHCIYMRMVLLSLYILFRIRVFCDAISNIIERGRKGAAEGRAR